MSSNNDAENLLEAALYTAFTPTSVRKDVPQPSISTTGTDKHEELAQPQTTGNPTDEKSSQGPSSDAWKEEYEAQVQKWRAKSTEAREKAEKERAKWEAIRAAQKEEAAHRETSPKASEGENVTAKAEHSPDTPVIISSEISGQHGESEGPTQADMTDTSQNWEDIHSSATSSFPSMTFPERTATPSPPPPARRQADIPQTATLAAFDPSLSARTRIKAVLASLAINLLLPFVNGVMLGFGEVFAKNVVIGWFGWQRPGSTAGSRGIGKSSRSRWWSR